ncbi:MAG: glycosyltransferase family 1 protein [Candidatus Berkelbacteria bacterium]|nr:glycosyltransferase family 1 protein [Candidatus Berkelbacteria bacterium]
MKIGICAYPLSKGKETGRGLERVVSELCLYFDRQKIRYAFYDQGIIKSEIKAILQGFNFIQFLKKNQDDCYFAIYPVSAIFPILAKKRPVVTAVHDLIPFYVYGYANRLKYALKRWCIRFACKRSDHLIVPFMSSKEGIIKLFNVPEDKISVIPYGVDHETYFADKSTERSKNQVAFLGEARRAKGMDTLIKAFKLVLDQVPEAKLVLASNGDELEKMKKLAAETLPDKSYSFAGFIPENEMRKFYSSSELFVFPSRFGFGLSTLEAMACGTPAICSTTLDSKDFMKDQDLLVDPENIAEVATKIIKLLLDPEKYKEKSAEALKIAKKFSWENMARDYYNVCVETTKQ